MSGESIFVSHFYYHYNRISIFTKEYNCSVVKKIINNLCEIVSHDPYYKFKTNACKTYIDVEMLHVQSKDEK